VGRVPLHGGRRGRRPPHSAGVRLAQRAAPAAAAAGRGRLAEGGRPGAGQGGARGKRGEASAAPRPPRAPPTPTPLQNQHINGTPCGCCWSFAATGVVEPVVALARAASGLPPPSLSEQQLIDCDRGPPAYDLGCQGGSVEGAVDYISKNGGLDAEGDYPYTGVDGKCRKKRAAHTVATVGRYVRVPKRSESALRAAVARHPVAVAVCCGDYIDDWHAYTGGVMAFGANKSVAGCPKPLDHAVVVVGYGSDASTSPPTAYWLVKNSWGEEVRGGRVWRGWGGGPRRERRARTHHTSLSPSLLPSGAMAASSSWPPGPLAGAVRRGCWRCRGFRERAAARPWRPRSTPCEGLLWQPACVRARAPARCAACAGSEALRAAPCNTSSVDRRARVF
jgi:hypothetical protein